MLRALGATSKLLTESITERVTNRKNEAKHRIDKIQKTSRDRITETAKSATNRLKNVRKNTIELTHNLSLGRKKHNKATNNEKTPTKSSNVFHLDRPQTFPTNDELFPSISFQSPLNCKTNKCMNINTAESSYEIPKNIRSTISSDSSSLSENASSSAKSSDAIVSTLPPPYDEVMKDVGGKMKLSETETNDAVQKSEIHRPARRRGKTDSNTYENHEIIVPTKNNDVKTEEASNLLSSEDDEEGVYSLPCPSFPAPVLTEGIYGKLRAKLLEQIDSTDSAEASSSSVQAPTRTKRRKDYEQFDIPNKSVEDLSSNRATADSTEFRAEGKFSKLSAQELSDDFTDKLALKEKKLPVAERSVSWSYHDANSDSQSDEPSSPEPIYENERNIRQATSSERVYGVLYNESDISDVQMLTPIAATRKKNSEERLSAQYAKVNKSPDVKLRVDNDVLKEFDPLDRKTFDKLLASKSNELILLENLLSEETYGTFADDGHSDYNTSENDTELSESEESEETRCPTPPERLDSLKECANEEIDESCLRSKNLNDLEQDGRKTVIIHQNTSLRSDSIENLVEQLAAASASTSSAAVVEETSKKTSNSRWFLRASGSDDDIKGKAKSDGKKGKKSKEEKLPTYNEAMGIDEKEKANAQIEKQLPPLSKTSSMKSMFSNVLNKVEGITRKTSFRSNPAKVEVKTVLEMIPRPSLTQRLILHEGHLIRLPTGVVEDILKELHSRKAYIRDKKFQAYYDKDLKAPKENIPLEWITTIQCVDNHKFSNHVVDIYCFEITTSIPKNTGNNLSNPNMVITSNNSGNTKLQRVCHLYGVAKESERFIWMQKLLESLTDVFPPGFSCRFYRAGWCYSKVKTID